MEWSSLATQFCLELAFGVLLGLCFLWRAPLGVFFFRLMGTTAVLPLLVAFAAPPLFAGRAWSAPAGLASLAAALAFPALSGPVRARTRALALGWCTLATALALVLVVRAAPAVEGGAALAVGSLSAMATGAVAGGVGLAMVVGHWYLTIPQLPLALLGRLNRLTAIAMACSAALVVSTLVLHRESFARADVPLLGPWGLFHLAARIATGVALPLLFAWMVAGSLRYRNTRSATGILYASTVLVLIGSAVSISLQDSYGVPL